MKLIFLVLVVSSSIGCSAFDALYAPIPEYDPGGGTDGRDTGFDVEVSFEADLGGDSGSLPDMFDMKEPSLDAPTLSVQSTYEAVELSWSPVEGASGYRLSTSDGRSLDVSSDLEFADTAGPGFYESSSLDASDAAHRGFVRLTFVAPEVQPLIYSVVAYDEDGDSPASNEVMAARLNEPVSFELKRSFSRDGTYSSIVEVDEWADVDDTNATVNGSEVFYRLSVEDASGASVDYEAQGRRKAVVQVSAGADHSCALLNDGEVKCWGENATGALGLGLKGDKGDEVGELPVESVLLGEPAIHVDADAGYTCAVVESGAVRCWGNGAGGATHALSLDDLMDEPGEEASVVPLPEKIVMVSLGASTSCALSGTGNVYCWGEGGQGQLCSGSRDDVGDEVGETPVLVPFGRAAVDVDVAGSHVCALMQLGDVQCWGGNLFGAVGNGVFADIVGESPGEVPYSLPLQASAHVATGGANSCALTQMGDLYCWGDNSTGLVIPGGDLFESIGDAPGEVPPPRNPYVTRPSTFEVGSSFGCYLLEDGRVYCWGDNSKGQLGRGDSEQIGDGSGDQVKRVELSEAATSISAGERHVCAVMLDGEVKCWGDNRSGQLGIGSKEVIGDETGEMPPSNVELWSD